MKLSPRRLRCLTAMTLVELMFAVGIGTAILAAFTAASVGLQRSFVAIEDYASGQNDQMRISDVLSLDMRRALSVTISGSAAHPPLTATMVIPNFYASANTPSDPYIAPVTGWPYKKHHHHHHQNIILNQVVQYGPANLPTLTVVYVFDSGTQSLSRTVYQGTFIPPTPVDPAKLTGTQIIANDVKDFSVGVSDLDETAQTQITFQPRFTNPASAAAISGTTYFQTTLTRNTR
jgi:hypothetical protein